MKTKDAIINKFNEEVKSLNLHGDELKEAQEIFTFLYNQKQETTGGYR